MHYICKKFVKTRTNMKKLLLTLFAAAVAVTAASAQEQGQWTVGPRMNIYTHTGTDGLFGIGAFARYNVTDAWRLEPGMTVLFHSHCSVDINCDVHYLFELTPHWRIYPLAGLNVSDIKTPYLVFVTHTGTNAETGLPTEVLSRETRYAGGWALGMNFGVGADFEVARDWDITAALKWMPVFESTRRNPFVISVGACYRF